MAMNEPTRYFGDWGTFDFYWSLDEAEKDGMEKGRNIWIAEMPVNGWFEYNGTNYKMKKYLNSTEKIVCETLDRQLYEIDASVDVIYIGRN